MIRAMLLASASIISVGLATLPAQAHPHVWVTVEATAVVSANAEVSGIQHKWTFDELYSSFAVQGLDKKGGNNPSREELKELAQLNMESLKEFGYFTHPRTGADKIGVKTPTDYYLEHKDGLLSLIFTLPLDKPVPANKAPLAFAVYDPTYFIAFAFAKDKALALAPGAPAGCVIEMRGQTAPEEADKLTDAFSKALGPGSGGSLMSDSVVVVCAEKK